MQILKKKKKKVTKIISYAGNTNSLAGTKVNASAE